MIADATIKKGYKQTEVGVIPEDWKINILKGVVETNRIPGGIYKEKKLYGSGIKIIKLGDVFRGDYFEPHNAQRVSLNRNELLNNQVYVGDIIIALASVKLEGVGKVMYVNKLDEDTAFDHNVALIRVNKDCNSKYIFYYLKSDKIRDVIRQLSTQVGTTFLKSNTIKEFNILLPPTKQEQNSIATVLSDTDALIERLEKLIAKKIAIKQGTMQQLLTGKKRLPGFEIKKGYKQTELGVIPEDWDVISYGEAFNFLSTASYSRADLSDDDVVFYVHYGDIHTTWNYFLDFKKSTLPTIEKIKVRTYSFIKDGDLIMADASEDYDGIGKSVEVKNITTNKAISGLHTFLLRGKEGIFVDGFKGYIHSNRLVKTSMDRLATGLKVYGVSKTNLKTIQIPRPTLPEQTAIATILSDMDAEIESLEQKRDKYTMLKQGMMQQLLTGRIRIHGTN